MLVNDRQQSFTTVEAGDECLRFRRSGATPDQEKRWLDKLLAIACSFFRLSEILSA